MSINKKAVSGFRFQVSGFKLKTRKTICVECVLMSGPAGDLLFLSLT
jgi:hypothetical protein